MHKIGRCASSLVSNASREARRRTCGSSRASLPRSALSKRALHIRRELEYPLEAGVADFLPPEALKTNVEWQDGLLDRLNDQVRGTENEGKVVLQTIIDTAADRERVMTYNYASLAANNSFFLDSIRPPSDGKTSNEHDVSGELKAAIMHNFNDFEGLQERFLASATGMVSSGWLWLVTDGQHGLAVVPTFGAGTLLVRSHNIVPYVQQDTLARQVMFEKAEDASAGASQPETSESSPSSRAASIPGTSAPHSSHSGSGPSPTSPVSGARTTQPPIDPHTPSRSFSAVSPLRFTTAEYTSVRSLDAAFVHDSGNLAKQIAMLGKRVYPLFCLSLYEHNWMSAGLGVWGKEEYVKRFFRVVDWKKASKAYTKFNTGKLYTKKMA